MVSNLAESVPYGNLGPSHALSLNTQYLSGAGGGLPALSHLPVDSKQGSAEWGLGEAPGPSSEHHTTNGKHQSSPSLACDGSFGGEGQESGEETQGGPLPGLGNRKQDKDSGSIKPKCSAEHTELNC